MSREDQAGTTTRSFARTEVRIPVRLRPLGEEEAERLASRFEMEPTYVERISFDARPSAAREKTWERAALLSLHERTERMEWMLRRIAEKLGVDLRDSAHWIEGETINLSGSGLGAWVPERLPEGSFVEVELHLVGDPSAEVRAVGRVVSLVHPDGENLPVGRWHLGIGFHGIHDEDREAVVRYTFRIQRAQLRDRKS